jgi:hypothetical protein
MPLPSQRAPELLRLCPVGESVQVAGTHAAVAGYRAQALPSAMHNPSYPHEAMPWSVQCEAQQIWFGPPTFSQWPLMQDPLEKHVVPFGRPGAMHAPPMHVAAPAQSESIVHDILHAAPPHL